MLFGIRTQGVASLALGYALVGLSARALSVVSQGKRLLAFSPLRLTLTHLRLCATLAFSPPCLPFDTPGAMRYLGLSVRFACLYCALCERLGAIGGPGAPVGGLAAHLQFEHAAAHDVVVE